MDMCIWFENMNTTHSSNQVTFKTFLLILTETTTFTQVFSKESLYLQGCFWDIYTWTSLLEGSLILFISKKGSEADS